MNSRERQVAGKSSNNVDRVIVEHPIDDRAIGRVATPCLFMILFSYRVQSMAKQSIDGTNEATMNWVPGVAVENR